ncbi:MAG: hypothetical protein RL217_188 [Pseudomonadota bacterium]|jgi:nicotinate-nucleotide--dimethylbenzimidazole phosphoribosyltransferase
MTEILWWQKAAHSPNESVRAEALARQNQLTKPQGSLGRLEEVAVQLAALQGQVRPQLRQPYMVVFAGDHGVVQQGVSVFPQSVTIAMLANFVQGGAAVSVLCQQHGIRLRVVNCGTATPCPDFPSVVQMSVMAGTMDFSVQAAMTEAQALQALAIGQAQVDELVQAGCDVFLGGEMGIGNTSSASCLSALLLKQAVASLVGPGTGVQGKALSHKVQVLTRALERARPLVHTPLQALVQVGGLEIAALAGAYVRAAQCGIPVLVDGFISSSAALLAVQLNPSVRPWLLFAHQSAEPGHKALLAALDAKPLLHLEMCLGEGSGAATAWVLLQAALAVHNRMATFAEAGVANKV